MALSPEFIAYIEELLQDLGPLGVKRMFGGAGVYAGGVMFALIMDDVLYLKADAETEPRFRAVGCTPFIFVDRHGRRTPLSYWPAPGEALESAETAAPWARQALGAALRTRAPARGRKGARPTVQG